MNNNRTTAELRALQLGDRERHTTGQRGGSAERQRMCSENFLNPGNIITTSSGTSFAKKDSTGRLQLEPF